MHKKKLFILMFYLLFLILVLGFFNIPQDITLNIVYQEEKARGEDYAQIFWDLGEGFNSEQSYAFSINDNITSLVLKSELYRKITGIRIDPTALPQNITIESVEIYRNDINVYELSGAQLEFLIESTYDISNYYVEDEKLIFEITGTDPQIYLNTTAKNLLNKAFVNIFYKAAISALGTILLIFYFLKNYIILYLTRINNQLTIMSNSLIKTRYGYLGVFIVCISFAILIVFWDYITFEKFFLFNDVIGSDSFCQTYPNLIELADSIEAKRTTSYWDFKTALGKVAAPVKLNINTWICYFGREAVPYLVGISYTLKILFSGLFFYVFLRTAQHSKYTSTILSIYYAFCGHMIVRGGWVAYPNEVLLVAIWLFAFERFHMLKEKRWLPIATLLFVYNLGAGYYFVFYSFIFIGYAALRYFTEKRICKKDITAYFLNYSLLLITGVVVFIPSLFSSFATATNSTRFKKNLSNTTDALFEGLFSVKEWLSSAYFRTIGMDIVGIDTDTYSGYRNFLEDPLFYCGILAILVSPIIFKYAIRKKKIGYSIVSIFIFIYILMPKIRIMINGFSKDTFKLSSFWIVIFILLLAAQALDMIFENKYKVNNKILPILFCVNVTIGVTIYLFVNKNINLQHLFISYCFMGLYTLIVNYYLKNDNWNASLKTIMLICVLVEVIFISYDSVNSRVAIDKEDLHRKVFYNDYTIDSLAFLENYDNDFYRIDKQYLSVFLCDALYQRYNGTQTYIGGTGYSADVAYFYRLFGLPHVDENWLWGTSTSSQINTLLGVKYILSKSDNIANYGYKYLNKLGDVYLYQNMYSLPIGIIYYNYIEEEEFLKVQGNINRQNLILKACILNSTNGFSVNIDNTDFSSITNNFPTLEIIQQDSEYMLPRTNTNNETIVLDIRATNLASGSATIGKIYYTDKSGHKNFYNIAFNKGSELYRYCLSADQIESINLEYDKSIITIDEIKARIVPDSIVYDQYIENSNSLKSRAPNIKQTAENSFEGKVNLEQDGFLVFSIPFDAGWTCYLDGEIQEIKKANIAFMGIEVQKGEHDIVLEFKGNDTNNIVSLIIVIYLVCLIAIYLKKKDIFKFAEIDEQ